MNGTPMSSAAMSGAARYGGRGQALAEFALAVGVLATLLLALPVICRYHSLQVATIEGARQLAFQSSWRVEGHGTGSGDGRGAPGAESLRALLLAPPPDADQVAAQRIESRLALEPTPGIAGTAMRVLLAPFRPLAALGSGFDLHDAGLSRADVTVLLSDPAGLPEPYAGAPPELSEHYALLGDGWASAGPGQVAQRAGGLVVARAVAPIQQLLSLGRPLLALVEPAFRQFCPGRVDPERVPADRLGEVSVDAPLSAAPWVAPC